MTCLDTGDFKVQFLEDREGKKNTHGWFAYDRISLLLYHNEIKCFGNKMLFSVEKYVVYSIFGEYWNFSSPRFNHEKNSHNYCI